MLVRRELFFPPLRVPEFRHEVSCVPGPPPPTPSRAPTREEASLGLCVLGWGLGRKFINDLSTRKCSRWGD